MVDESGLRLNWAAEEVGGGPQHRLELTPAPGLTVATALRHAAPVGHLLTAALVEHVTAGLRGDDSVPLSGDERHKDWRHS